MGGSISDVLLKLAALMALHTETMRDNIAKIQTAILNNNTGHLPEWIRLAGGEVSPRQPSQFAASSDEMESDLEYTKRVMDEIVQHLKSQPGVVTTAPWLLLASTAREPDHTAVAEFVQILKTQL